jgi:SpoVK/Ycf46/Vps4 family AAA+-type ATPase
MTGKPSPPGNTAALSARKVPNIRKFDDVALDHGVTSVASLQAWIKNAAASTPAGPVLLAGAPGVGKADSAQIIAKNLGRPLVRIDLAGIVSKYIGETEAALDRIFDEAERSGAVLLLDEADDVFSKRTSIGDAHDRYAGIDTGHLLDRLARYTGTLIVTSTNKANLDPAFLRRIRHVIDFPKPGGGR